MDKCLPLLAKNVAILRGWGLSHALRMNVRVLNQSPVMKIFLNRGVIIKSSVSMLNLGGIVFPKGH